MEGRALVIILFSLLAGAAGGVGASMLAGQAKSAATSAEDNSAVLEALQRIESRLASANRTGLQGTANTATGGSGSVSPMETLAADESADGPMARLLARIDEAVGKSLEAKFEELQESGDGMSISIGTSDGKSKKKVTFDEMVRELELSAEEEGKLREILKNTENEALKLLAEEGQDIEDLRRELQEKSRTPEGKAEMRGKMMTKFMSNAGGFINLFMKHESSVKTAVGATKAAKIDNSYRVVDPDFIDFDAFEMN